MKQCLLGFCTAMLLAGGGCDRSDTATPSNIERAEADINPEKGPRLPVEVRRGAVTRVDAPVDTDTEQAHQAASDKDAAGATTQAGGGVNRNISGQPIPERSRQTEEAPENTPPP